MKSKNTHISSPVLNNGKCITESATIANMFNGFFQSVSPAIQSKIKFLYIILWLSSFKKFWFFHHNSYIWRNYFLPKQQQINRSQNYTTKIIKLTQNEISQHLVDIFHLSLKTWVFRDSLKIAEVIPIHKKDSKLVVSNYRPRSIFSKFR